MPSMTSTLGIYNRPLILLTTGVILSVVLSVVFILPVSAVVEEGGGVPSTGSALSPIAQADSSKPTGKKCPNGYVETSFKINDSNCVPINKGSTSPNDNPIFFLLTQFLKFFSALVGVAVTGGIIYGGILWSTAKGNPSQTQKATAVISNAILGLILYILMFAIINFLVPGGLFK